MVFVSQNKIRKCRWCENPPAEILSFLQKNGKHRKKGYYRTCGSEECKKKQYKCDYICKAKGKLNIPVDHVCVCCGEPFKGLHGNHKRYCLECCPTKAWRSRCGRYAIGKKQWDTILSKQNGTCALCDRNPEVIDHCHSTGKIRGLLCNKCNGNIKFLDMDKDFKERALKYIGEESAIC